MDKKAMITLVGIVGGMAAISTAGVMVWNSKQLRAMRAVKRTGRILYQVGTALRSISGVMTE
jgi:hypothetical protein